MENIRELDRLFNPASLALIGASNDPIKSGGLFLKALIDGHFTGKLFPVNPAESAVMGLKSYRSVLEIPGEIDLAILTVPARLVPQVILECSQKRVKFAVVHSAGFSELGPEGKALEEKMLMNARQSGIRLIGPNCMGLYSPGVHMNTITPRTPMKDEVVGHVAFVGQSGWISENFIQMCYERGLRFSQVVSVGNQSDLTIEDLLEYYAADPKTKVIAFYVEGLKQPRRFLKLAGEISKKKPIIAWKGGRSAVGGRAAASHTGSLAGNKTAFDAALVQIGIARVDSIDDLVDLAVAFSCPVMPQGRRLGLLVEAGGGAVSGSDAAEIEGLDVPPLPPEIQKQLTDRLTGVLPPFSNTKNPVDLIWTPKDTAVSIFADCSRIMARAVDAIIMVSYEVEQKELGTELAKVRDETGKPLLMIPGHPVEQRTSMSRLTEEGIPTFPSPQRAVKALAAMVRYSRYLSQQ